MTKRVLLLLVIVSSAGSVLAQDSVREEFRPQIRGAIMMAHSHVPSTIGGAREVLVIPTWGFDVDYFFHRRWSTALQGDVKIQSFEVEDGEAVLNRTNPVALTLALHYHALRHWSFYMGPGIELESHKNLFQVKMGTEYSFEINENFEIALNLVYENKAEVYDSWTIGVAFNKVLWRKK